MDKWPVKMGSLARSPCMRLAEKIAKALPTYINHESLVVTVDHHLDVWLELPGHEIDVELAGCYDTSRHWLDLQRQLDGDLLQRKQEIEPPRIRQARI